MTVPVRRYEVYFQKEPSWEVGEHTENRDERMRSGVPARSSECWPGNYSGRVTSSRAVADVKSGKLPSLRNMSDKDHPVVVLDLDDDGVASIASHKWKIVDGRPEPVTFDDRFGAVAFKLRERHADPEAWERDEYTRVETEEAENKKRREDNERDVEEYRVRKEDFPRELHQWSMIATDEDIPPAWPERPKPQRLLEVSPSRFDEEVASLTKTLAPTVTHTGTGLYATKVTPTHNDDTQSGAPAGQVITLVTGGLGILGAFKGGYVYNATRSELRAIVSHTNGTGTLEGDLTNWLAGDDLDIYDAWSTIQATCDQLDTDQGATAFDATQELRLHTGTFTENVVLSTSLVPTFENILLVRAATGESPVIDGTAGNCWTNVLVRHIRFEDIAFTTTGGYGIYDNASSRGNPLEVTRCSFAGKNGIYLTFGGGNTLALITDTTFALTGIAVNIRNRPVRARGCTFTGSGAVAVGFFCYGTDVFAEGCTFRGMKYALQAFTAQPPAWDVRNCAFYGSTVADFASEWTDGGTTVPVADLVALNNIHMSSALVYWLPSRTRLTVDRNCIYNATKVARVNVTDYTTLADWQAYADDHGTSPDANSIDSDPLLTDPASGDFSLGTGSPCLNAGYGSGVAEGVNGVAFDKHHPDIGAWSSGVRVLARPTAVIKSIDHDTREIVITVSGVADIFRAELFDLDSNVVASNQITAAGDITVIVPERGVSYSVAVFAGDSTVPTDWSQPGLASTIVIRPEEEEETAETGVGIPVTASNNVITAGPLGAGLAFPFRFSSTTGAPQTNYGIDHVVDGMTQILMTGIGSRIIRRDFGSAIAGKLFSPDTEIVSGTSSLIQTSLANFERRAEVTSIVFSRDRVKGKVTADIKFRTFRTQKNGNLVYPFSMSE